MSLWFSDKWITDTHGPLVVPSPELPVRYAKYWAVRGEGAIVGEKGGRPILCTGIVHYQFTKLKDFEKQISKIEDLQGQVGTLEEAGELTRKYKNVLFEGFEPLPLGGQEEPGPLLDVGVLTITTSSGSVQADNGYFAGYFFRFRQLKT
jgi:hypothetical protein